MSDTPRLHTAGNTLLERARALRPLIERDADQAEEQADSPPPSWTPYTRQDFSAYGCQCRSAAPSCHPGS
ncbi:hypothetical protein PW035_41265 [Nonomuraea angiospora]|nr:hypothetical protein [Nonomuraea angiospora]MDX3107311.1 hypothetical protein [Nonomuraea angiospora]